jgi:cyclopropane fatty-acyl-phospholipid synthase-like methyltransferase
LKQTSHSERVGSYYDLWHERYMKVYGEVIQAYRPSSQSELLNYLQESIGLADGLKVVDAGCGICVPSIFFAECLDIEIHGVTISKTQVKEASIRIAQKHLEGRVKCIHGDYHYLDQLFSANDFDGVMFLESLGHAFDADMVIRAASRIIRHGGFIYIKDFFPRETDDEVLKTRIEKTIANINKEYCYNVLDLHRTLTSLRKEGFAITSIKGFDFVSDISVRATFESEFDIDVFEGGEFAPAEWLEIKCHKVFDNSSQ